jgi:hypothetical protein
MHVINSIRRYWFLSICALIFSIWLVACGSTASTSNSSSSASQSNSSGSTSSSTSSAIVNGYGTANGCPSNAVVTGGSSNVNVIVKVSQMNQIIPIHNGDIVEVQLPFGHKWTGPTTSQGILQLQGPAGYASKSANACIWRFVVKGTGRAQLMFHSQALCQAGQVCPMYITAIPFEFNIQ